jgi:hypothetical protein
VVAWPLPDGFIMPLPYGADMDWCRNVLDAGQGTIHWQGMAYTITKPAVIATATARPLLPAWAEHCAPANSSAPIPEGESDCGELGQSE